MNLELQIKTIREEIGKCKETFDLLPPSAFQWKERLLAHMEQLSATAASLESLSDLSKMKRVENA